MAGMTSLVAGLIMSAGQPMTPADRLHSVNPNVAKAGGLQSQGVKGEVVVVYLESLTTQDLKSSGFPAG
jgi:hypothetical protein